MTQTATLPGIKRTVSVSWTPQDAFRRFTADFGRWWPHRTHSIGGSQGKRVVFECQPGGRIWEELKDGRRFQWGRVTAFEAPDRVAFSWHPSREESTAQDVEVRFIAEGSGTRVELTSTGWERWGEGAEKARKGYHIGWGAVLDEWAGRPGVLMLVFRGLARTIELSRRIRGTTDAEIAKAGGAF